jgi:hypothetical protein
MWHLKKLDTQSREVVRDLLQLLADKGRPAGHGMNYNFEYNKGAVDGFTRWIQAHDITNNTQRPKIARYRKNSVSQQQAMFGNRMFSKNANPYDTNVQIAQRILDTYSKWVELGADRLTYHGKLFLHDYHYNHPNTTITPSNSFVPNQIQNANTLKIYISLSTPQSRADPRGRDRNMPVDNNRTHWNLEVNILTDKTGIHGNGSAHLTYPLWEESWLRAQLQGSLPKPVFDINSIRSNYNIPRYGIVQERCLLRLWKELLYGLLEGRIHTMLH